MWGAVWEGAYNKVLSAGAQDSINHYYEYKFANKCMFDEQSIYNELPAKLRADLLLHRYKEIVEKVPFFRNCRDDAIVEIVSQFHSFSVRRQR